MKVLFKDRLIQILKNKNISQSTLSYKTGIANSSISDWINGKYEPKQDKIDILSKFLNISPAYLMGWDEKKDNLDFNIIYEHNSPYTFYSDNEINFINKFNKLNDKGKEYIHDQLNFALLQKKYKK